MKKPGETRDISMHRIACSAASPPPIRPFSSPSPPSPPALPPFFSKRARTMSGSPKVRANSRMRS